MDVKKIIGWNLRYIRSERGLSQERLALEAQIDRSYVGRVERGMENVTVSTLEAMATALNVPVSALFVEPQADAEKPKGLKAGRKPKRL